MDALPHDILLLIFTSYSTSSSSTAPFDQPQSPQQLQQPILGLADLSRIRSALQGYSRSHQQQLHVSQALTAAARRVVRDYGPLLMECLGGLTVQTDAWLQREDDGGEDAGLTISTPRRLQCLEPDLDPLSLTSWSVLLRAKRSYLPGSANQPERPNASWPSGNEPLDGGFKRPAAPRTMWDIFARTDVSHDTQLVDIADLFSQLAIRSFARLRSGKQEVPQEIGGAAAEATSGTNEQSAEEEGQTVPETFELHFFMAVVLAALRSLSRRPSRRSAKQAQAPVPSPPAPVPPGGDDTEGEPFSTTFFQERAKANPILQDTLIDARLKGELNVLRSALKRCDPLQVHQLLRRGQHQTVARSLKGKGVVQDRADRSPSITQGDDEVSDCPCCDRTWMAWYSIAWQFLLSRYKRFFNEEDIAHVTYRVILFSAFSFPTANSDADANTLKESTRATRSQWFGLPLASVSGLFRHWRADASGGPGVWVKTPSTGVSPSDLHSKGMDAFNLMPPSLSSPQVSFFYASLNPDAVLFNLKESPTYQLTKEWFGVSEYLLPPGLARQWASWLGYQWGEGGLYWRDRERGHAERRLRTKIVSGGAEEAQGDASPSSPKGNGSDRAYTPFTRQLRPIEIVILSHARWRARTLLSVLSDTVSGNIHPERLAQCRDFDVHFVRRCSQIQAWAVYGVTEHASLAAAASAAYGSATISNHALSTLTGAVHPSSPFLSLEGLFSKQRVNFALGPSWWRFRPSRAKQLPLSELEPVRIAQAWADILAPMRFAIREATPESADPKQWQEYALRVLGDLHAGAPAGALHPACSELPGFVPTVPMRAAVKERPRPPSKLAFASALTFLPLTFWMALAIALIAAVIAIAMRSLTTNERSALAMSPS